MKTLFPILASILLLTNPFFAQSIQITATGGTLSANYSTLNLAFNAINSGTHTGSISVNIVGNTTETTTATLNSSGSGSASYTAINIQPSGGAARTISGTIAGALIDLNGADNVTIDGLNTGGNSLVIENLSTSVATTGTTAYTLKITNTASSVNIKKATLKGAAGSVIYMTASGTNGNDSFWLDDSEITSSSTGFTNTCILFEDSKADNTKVTNCRISDFYTPTADTYGIRIINLGTNCDITGNSFYQTAQRNIGKDLYFIGAIANATVANLTISNNVFGGKSANGGSVSSPLVLTDTGALKCISLIIGSANIASIQNNQIKNIKLSTTGNNIMISLATGSFNCGNTTGNSISNITTTVSSGKSDFTGILAGTGTAKNYNISNNTIKDCTVQGAIEGINIGGASALSYIVSNNLIYNLIVSSGASDLKGLVLNSGAASQNINKNTLYNLESKGSGDVLGIDFNSSGTNTVIQQNKIYNLTSTNATYGMSIIGINVAPPNNTKIATFSNNMIALGNTVTKQIKIYGFQESNKVGCFYYNNSVYLGGNITSVATSTTTTTPPTQNSASFYSNDTLNSLSIKNNIFVNMRSNGVGTATNYSIHLVNNTSLGIDNNIYFGNTGSGSGYKIGNYYGAFKANYCDWKSAIGVGKEINSIFKDPKFIDPTNTTTPDLHIQASSPVESQGVSITGITTDFDGNTRSSTPDIGADEGSFTLEPVVTLASLGGPYCTNNGAITLSGGSPTGSGGSFSGTGVSGGNTFTPSVSGTFAITYTFTNNLDICNSATQNITVNALITANAGTNQTNSSGNFIMAANAPTSGTGEWSLVSGTATITDISSANTTISGVPLNTTAVLRWTITNGACTSTSDVSLSKQATLPLNLLSFSVNSSKTTNILQWNTANENNVKGFEIQRSPHMNNFKSIHWQAAKGDGLYNFEDADISANTTYYYRLVMLDKDGKFEYSPIKSSFIENAVKMVKIYPNPTANMANLSIFSPFETTALVTLRNTYGQIFQSFSTQLTVGENTILLEINTLPTGLYFLNFETNNVKYGIKIIKN